MIHLVLMRNLIIIPVFVTSAFMANAQQPVITIDTPKKPQPIIVKDTLIKDTIGGVIMLITREPHFKLGGVAGFYAFIKRNLNQTGDKGKVMVSFCVDKDGSLTQIYVVQSLSDSADREAINVVSKSPKWVPGVQNGIPQRVHYTIPVTFGDN